MLRIPVPALHLSVALTICHTLGSVVCLLCLPQPPPQIRTPYRPDLVLSVSAWQEPMLDANVTISTVNG